MKEKTLEIQNVKFTTNMAKNLQLARNVSNLTQTDIAKKANVSRATIAQIESGESDPRLSTIINIATALRISPVLLLMGEDEVKALENLAENYQKGAIPEEEVEKMRQLLSSGIQKFTQKAGEIGSKLYEKRKDPRVGPAAGAATGAAIGSTLMPGVGTLIGASLGAFFSSKTDLKDDEEEN